MTFGSARSTRRAVRAWCGWRFRSTDSYNGVVLPAVLASLVIAALAWWRGALSLSGAAAALLVGTAVWAGGGAAWFAALMIFFVTSTALGRVGRAAKEATKREFSKGDRRDALQVLAN